MEIQYIIRGIHGEVPHWRSEILIRMEGTLNECAKQEREREKRKANIFEARFARKPECEYEMK